MFDFERLRKTRDHPGRAAFLASTFLEILNVFLLFPSLFGWP